MKKESLTIEKILLALTFFFMNMMIFQIGGKCILLYIELLLCGYAFIKYNKVIFIKNIYINLFFVLSIFTCLFSQISDIPATYKKASVRNTVTALVIYFVLGYLLYILKNKKSYIELLRRILKVTCLLNVFWTIVQFILYTTIKVDLNKVVFEDTLHMMENPTAYKDGILQPSGFAWHPACMAPIIAISYFMFDNILVKVILIITSCLTGNITSMIGICLCVFFDVYKIIKKKQIKRDKLIFCIFALLCVICALYFSGIYNIIFDKVGMIIDKINGNVDENSSKAHKLYFTAFPLAMQNSSLLQIIFGYGIGCSGYIFTKLFAQYPTLPSWSVECDIMDMIYSRGILGAIIFYLCLFSIIRKGVKINEKYAFLMLVIIAQGITYQGQFAWVLLFEFLLVHFVNSEYDIFEGKFVGVDNIEKAN